MKYPRALGHVVVKRPALVRVLSSDDRVATDPTTLRLAFDLVDSYLRVYPSTRFTFHFVDRVQACAWPRPRYL